MYPDKGQGRGGTCAVEVERVIVLVEGRVGESLVSLRVTAQKALPGDRGASHQED